MQFTAEQYLRAARERIIEAGVLYDKQHYVLSMYVAGLAVECMLRAFRFRIDPVFDSRHDLRVLFRESRIIRLHEDALDRRGVDPERSVEAVMRFRAAHDEVIRLWRNDYRFAAQTHVLGWLKEIKAYVGIKGDVLKANARRLLMAARLIIDIGVTLWTSKKR